jgi:hypothetical protein
MTIDWTKPVRHKSYPHSKVRVLATDLPGNHNVVSLVDDFIHRSASSYYENIPEPRFVWINVYHSGAGYNCESRASADHANRGSSRAHVLRINIDTGECVKESA